MLGVGPQSRVGECGGSLITQRFVLSAAHCFQGRLPDQPSSVRVYLGRHHRMSKGTEYAVEEVIIHPDWLLPTKLVRAPPNDIALLRLSKDAELSSTVSMVCLPSGPQDSPPPGTRALFSGWGMNENSTLSDELQYNWVHIISLDECKERGAKHLETNLCTYDKTILKDGAIIGGSMGSGLE